MYIYIYIHEYTYIYIYIYTHILPTASPRRAPRRAPREAGTRHWVLESLFKSQKSGVGRYVLLQPCYYWGWGYFVFLKSTANLVAECVGRQSCGFVVCFLFVFVVCQNFAGISPEFCQNFSSVSYRSAFKKGITHKSAFPHPSASRMRISPLKSEVARLPLGTPCSTAPWKILAGKKA